MISITALLERSDNETCKWNVLVTYRNPHEGLVRLDEVLVAVAPEGQSADEGGDDELGREDGVDLADELVADVDRGLGDGAAKLEVVRDVVLAAARLAKDVGRARCRLGAGVLV